MSSRSATAIIVTSDSCGACKQFENTGKRDQAVAAINSLPNVQAQVIKIPDLTQISMANLKNYHPDLPKFVAWFPTLILANETWHDRSSKLQGVVYGGELENNQLKPTKGFGLNWFQPNNLKEWIPGEMKENKMFASLLSPSHNSSHNSSPIMNNNDVMRSNRANRLNHGTQPLNSLNRPMNSFDSGETSNSSDLRNGSKPRYVYVDDDYDVEFKEW